MSGISDMPSFLLALEAAGVAAGLGWQGAGNSISAQDWLAEFASNGAGRSVLIIDDAQILPQDVMDFLSQLIASARDALTTRSEEHTSELQSLMRISCAVFC